MSSADQYLVDVLARHDPFASGRGNLVSARGQAVAAIIQHEFASWMSQVMWSGSFAKGTAITGASDADLFLSFHTTPTTLRDIYEEVFELAARRGWGPRRQNVSIGISVGGIAIDLVPGRQQQLASSDHSIYRRRAGTWTKTNIETHVRLVKNSGLTPDVRLVKIWRRQHGLDFPSFAAELATIRGIRETSPFPSTLAGRFAASLAFLAKQLPTARLEDPANASNNVADDMSVSDKAAIARTAAASLNAKWGDVIR